MADTVRGFGTEQYPLVVVIMKNRSSLEVSAVLQGNLFNTKAFSDTILPFIMRELHYIFMNLFSILSIK